MNRLFLFEAYVNCLHLNEYSLRNCQGSVLRVKIHFANLPVLEVTEYDRTITETERCFKFEAGSSIHFSSSPEALENALKRSRAKIKVCRVDDNFPICEFSTFLSGCICDLVSKAEGFESSPFKFKGPFALVDPGGYPSGSIETDFFVYSLGRYNVTHFGLVAERVILKKSAGGLEFSIQDNKTPVPNIECRACLPYAKRKVELRDEDVEKLVGANSFILDIAGISLVADRLALGKPPARGEREPLVDPNLQIKKGKKGKRGKKGKKGKK